MLHKLKTNVLLVTMAFAMGTILNCAQELPLKELALAKAQVERAENLKAGEFSPDEFQEAKKSLIEANDYAAEEKASDSKKSADYAISKAYDALEKTLPKLTARTREEAIANLDAAEEANASETSPEEFKKASALKDAGDAKLTAADGTLAAYLREEKDEKQKETKRSQALNEYEEAYNLFLESKRTGMDAKAVALQKADGLRQSADEVDASLQKASRYYNGTNPAVEEEKSRLQSAYADIEAGRLKTADGKIKTARAASGPLLASSIKDHAKSRNSQARDVVEDANVRFADLPSDSLLKSPSTKDSYGSAQENLGAANESLASSSNLYEQEKYEDSLSQSEEAIRLAEISIDQVETLKLNGLAVTTDSKKKDRGTTPSDKLATKKDAKTKTDTTTPNEESTNEGAGSRGLKDLGDGWKQYTVSKSNPADCLWRIAKKADVYNNSKLWPRIYDANRGKIKNKNLIFPKQKLNIPPKSGKIGTPPGK
jgi:hypothetical protein